MEQYLETFNLQLVITTKCNLGCKYCYMKNIDSSMTGLHIESIHNNIKNVLNKYKCKNYSVAYFGGEPLVAWPLITKYDNIFKNDPLCKYRLIISNGLLLDNDKIDFIKNNNIGFSWSFDGLGNKDQRVDIDNKDTLDRYLEKLEIIKTLSAHNCKVMISPSSLSYMVDNYIYLSDTIGINNVDYSLVRDDIWTDNDIQIFEIELKKLSKIYIERIKNNINTTIGFFNLAWLDMLTSKKIGKRPFGCFAGCSGLGFMPDGKAYGCARFGANNKLPIYDYLTNTWNEESFNILSDPKIANPMKYPKCDNCYLRLYCNGMCNYNILNNNYDPIESICKLYKIINKEAILIFDELKNNKFFIDILLRQFANIN